LKNENVDHPAHYGGDTPYEVIKVAEAWGFDKNAYLFNVLKYIARPTKGHTLEDLKKARWYLDRLIDRLEGESAKAPEAEKPEYTKSDDIPLLTTYSQTVRIMIPFRGYTMVYVNKAQQISAVALYAVNRWNRENPKDKVVLPAGFKWTLGTRVHGAYGVTLLPRTADAVSELRPFLDNRKYDISLERTGTV